MGGPGQTDGISERLAFVADPPVRERRFAIGAIGAGFIMADVHLAAYTEAGFRVAAIASRTPARARAAAERWSIPVVHATPAELIADPAIEILDLAFPPDRQPALIRAALGAAHIRGILAQKPLAVSYAEARALVAEAKAAGKVLSVNQNMRYDQAMRALRQTLTAGHLGEPVLASIDMRAVPHWQGYLAAYERLTLLNMSIHHFDILRFLFGEPMDIYTVVRADPRDGLAHRDGITASTLRFPGGLIALSLEDVWAGPDGLARPSITWRVEGTRGLARGTIGWPDYPAGSPSRFAYAAAASGGAWIEGDWSTRWFPQAFIGTMEQLQYAVATGTPPAISAEDNLMTMALVEAAYRSAALGRPVAPVEIKEERP